MTVAGSITDYDDAAQNDLIFRMAVTLGVLPTAISLTVAAASVRLLFSIKVPDRTEASAILWQATRSLGTAQQATTAMAANVMSTPTVILEETGFETPGPPSLPQQVDSVLRGAPPPPANSSTELDSYCEFSTCTNEDITGLYVLAAGLAVTASVLVIGIYSKVKLQLATSAVVSILIASGDAFTDIAFAMQQLSIMEDLLDTMTSALLVLFLVVPIAWSAHLIVPVLRSPHLDTGLLQERSAFYAFVLLVSLTNMEVLRVLPWQQGTAIYDGLPDQKLMVKVWLIVMFLEDFPQLCIQTVLTIKGGGGLLGPLSLGFTLVALIWRALRSEASQKHTLTMRYVCAGRLPTAHLRQSTVAFPTLQAKRFTCYPRATALSRRERTRLRRCPLPAIAPTTCPTRCLNPRCKRHGSGPKFHPESCTGSSMLQPQRRLLPLLHCQKKCWNLTEKSLFFRFSALIYMRPMTPVSIFPSLACNMNPPSL